MKRRSFLAQSISTLAAVKTGLAGGASRDRVKGKVAKLQESNESSGAVPARLGNYYERTVPDTLDLAERAHLGLHHYTNSIFEDHGYEMPLTVDFAPPVLQFHMNSLGTCQAKAMEAMAELRVASGSHEGVELESKMVQMMASGLGNDGLYWVPGGREDKPWIEIKEPFAVVFGQASMMGAMIAWYQYTGDPAWKTRIDRLINGLDRTMVFHKDDYAYFPVHGYHEGDYLRSCYTKRGWQDTVEPTTEKYGEEGSLFNHQGIAPYPLAVWYQLTGNEQALHLAGELVRFLTKPQFWADWKGGEYPGVGGAEHAHWHGHFHGYMNTLRSILEYAIATDDAHLMEFVRDGYEWSRQAGMPRVALVGDLQGCGCGRLIGLATKLTYAGVGDYWEDIDQYIRNGGIELQIANADIARIEDLQKNKPATPPNPQLDEVALKSGPGSFAGRTKSCWWLCCSPRGNMGIFYVWDGIIRHSDGVAKVNLLLNRASPWMDIDSYLPYEGKVVLHNKTAREASVRIPLYVKKQTVRLQVVGRERTTEWDGRYLQLKSLKPGDVATISFPLEETTERWTSPTPYSGPDKPHCSDFGNLIPPKTAFTFKFKGNTVVGVNPPLMPQAPGGWLFQDRATKLQADAAPMKKVNRFVTPAVLRW